MTKASGIGWTTCSVDDSGGSPQAIKNDVTDLSFSTPRGVQDITGIDKSAKEALLLLADFSISLKGVWNSSTANQAHDVFKTISSTSATRTITLVVNSATLANECILTDYQLARSTAGELTWTVPGQLSDGTVPTWS